jgi:hypothetical protein
MIPASDMKFYLDPVQDMTLKAARLYVTEEAYPRGRGSAVGTIVDVKENSFDSSAGKYWWVTDDGQFVRGAPISRNSPNYSQHVSLLDDGVFIVGEYYGTASNGEVGILAGCVRSDGKVRPGRGSQYRVENWMKAASWASALMPAPGDSVDVIAAKVALAKEKYKRRNAMRVILSEAMERDWNTDLESLREDHNIPHPTFGAYVDAEALLSIGASPRVETESLTEDERAKVARLTGRLAMRSLEQRVAVPVKFMAGLTISPGSSPTAINASTIASAARARFDDYSINIGSYSLTPILRTLTAS